MGISYSIEIVQCTKIREEETMKDQIMREKEKKQEEILKYQDTEMVEEEREERGEEKTGGDN